MEATCPLSTWAALSHITSPQSVLFALFLLILQRHGRSGIMVFVWFADGGADVREVVGRWISRQEIERVDAFDFLRKQLLAVEVNDHPGDQLLLDEDGIPGVDVR